MGAEYIVFLRAGDRFKQLSVPLSSADAEDFAKYWSKPDTTLVVVQVVSQYAN